MNLPKGKYVLMDVESGGLSPFSSSLLTIYCAILDENLNILSEVDLKLRPDSGEFQCNSAALAVNGIDLKKHDADPMTISCSRANSILKKLFEMHKPEGRYTVLGQNISFDLSFVWFHIMNQNEWHKYVESAVEDTYKIAKQMKTTGKIPSNQKLKLGLLANYLGISYAGGLHNAKADSLLTLEVYKHLKLLKNKNT